VFRTLQTETDVPEDGASVDMLLFLEARVSSSRTATLLASGAQGWIRAWSVAPDGGGLLGQFNASHCHFEATVQMATDGKNEFLVTGRLSGGSGAPCQSRLLATV